MKEKIKFYDQNMGIPDETGEAVYYYDKLMYVLYDAPVCCLHFSDDSQRKEEIALHEIMRNLPQYVFFQCNKATIINFCHYKGYNKVTRTVTMNDGVKFHLSRRRVTAFKSMKNSLPRLSPSCPACYTCTKNDCANRVIFCR